jgi:hypothetical protein
MNNKYTASVFSFCLCAAITGCTTTTEKTIGPTPVEPTHLVNDYPTRDRVEYVLNCVAQHGGLTYITQYACGCKIDKIAEKMTFKEFEDAKTFT